MSTTDQSSSDEETPGTPEARTRPGRTEPPAAPAKPVEPEEEGAGAGGLDEADPHDFAAAFSKTIRSDGAHGRSGRTILIGVAAVAIAAVAAVVSGSLAGSKHPAAAAKPTASADASGPVSPSGTAHAGKANSGTDHGAPDSQQARQAAGGDPGAQPGPSGASKPAGAAAVTAASTSAPAAATQTTGASTTAVTHLYAGPGCTSENFGEYTYFTGGDSNGTTGWSTQSGGYSGNGCSGKYVSMPLNGKSTGEDNHVLWKFSKVPVGAACTIKVYIPSSTNIALVGGNPAHYSYTLDGSTAATSFTIDQLTHRGEWVTEKTVTSKTGLVDVRLANTGVDFGSSSFNAHVAASAVELSCVK